MTESILITTAAGRIRGAADAGVARFFGIPYAQPPVGPLRFAAPMPRAPWSHEHDGTRFGATPQQRFEPADTIVPEPSIRGADILNLNVFAPAALGGGAAVLVYFHGGAFETGSPVSPWYDGSAFARDGIIVVTVGYRLGIDGFGALGGATPNRGVLDWIAALEWVRDNIAAFGGDPARVTIAGQSAGGSAVIAIMAIERARGLFARAIALSAAMAELPDSWAETTAQSVASEFGVTPTASGFGSIEPARFHDRAASGAPRLERAEEVIALVLDGPPRKYGPVVDGDLITRPAVDRIAEGSSRDVPLLLCSTADEFSLIGRFNAHLLADLPGVDVLEKLGMDRQSADAYQAAVGSNAAPNLLGRYVTDDIFRRRVLDVADARPAGAQTWVADMRWASGVTGVALHCIELPFLFDMLAADGVAAVLGENPPQDLADIVHGDIVRFVNHGDPGWPEWDAENPCVKVYDVESAVRDASSYESARIMRNALSEGRTR